MNGMAAAVAVRRGANLPSMSPRKISSSGSTDSLVPGVVRAEAAAPTASPAARALERLEREQRESERLFALQREATERLLAQQRKVLEECRRTQGQPPQQGSLEDPRKVHGGFEDPAKADLVQGPEKLGRQTSASVSRAMPRGGSAGSHHSMSDGGDSDSSGSEAASPFAAFLQKRWLGEGAKRGSSTARGGYSTRLQRSSTEWAIVPRNCLQESLLPIVQSTTFRLVVASLVILNSVYFGMQVHFEVHHLMFPNERDLWYDHEGLCRFVKRIFAIMVVTEVTVRLLAEQGAFLSGPNRHWNLFDSVIVIVAIVDEFYHENSGGSIGAIRAFRLVRAVRVVRVFRFMRNLRLMLFSILSCLMSIFWALLLLAFIMFGFVLYLEHALLYYHQDGREVSESEMEMYKDKWDGIPQGMRSLVYSISGGADWGDLAEPFWRISNVHGIMYMMFILFTIFGLMNVMVGVFVQEAAEILKWDRDLVLEEALDKEDARMKQLKDLFYELDPDGSGTITLEELTQGMADPRTKAYFAHLNIDMAQAPEFFGFLDSDQSGVITMDEFVRGCIRFQGSAKPLEVASLLTECRGLSRKMDTLNLEVLDLMPPAGSAPRR